MEHGETLMDTTTEHDTIGGRLRALRRSARLTQADLGKRLGLSDEQVGRTERGHRLADYALVEQWVLGCGGSARDVEQAVAVARAALPEAIDYGPESAV